MFIGIETKDMSSITRYLAEVNALCEALTMAGEDLTAGIIKDIAHTAYEDKNMEELISQRVAAYSEVLRYTDYFVVARGDSLIITDDLRWAL